MSEVHLYTRDHQPATRFVTDLGQFEGGRYTSHRVWTRLRPRARVWASCCKRRRWAAHCTVQVYYDMLPFWCRPGRGCNAT